MGVICRSTKVYFSYKEPAKHIEYTSEILSGGPRGPLFSVTASDDLDNPIQGSTATACWSTILNKVRKERTRQGLGKTGTAVSGPEFFGYAMPEIAACIEGLDGADTCKNYVCRCLRMDTNEINAPARALYARLGYREADVVPCDFNGLGQIRLVCLEKRLDAEG